MLQSVEYISESHSVVIRPNGQRLLSADIVDIEISQLVGFIGALIALAANHRIGVLDRLHWHLGLKCQFPSAPVFHEHTDISYLQDLLFVATIVINYGKALAFLSPLHLTIWRHDLCCGSICQRHSTSQCNECRKQSATR